MDAGKFPFEEVISISVFKDLELLLWILVVGTKKLFTHTHTTHTMHSLTLY